MMEKTLRGGNALCETTTHPQMHGAYPGTEECPVQRSEGKEEAWEKMEWPAGATLWAPDEFWVLKSLVSDLGTMNRMPLNSKQWKVLKVCCVLQNTLWVVGGEENRKVRWRTTLGWKVLPKCQKQNVYLLLCSGFTMCLLYRLEQILIDYGHILLRIFRITVRSLMDFVTDNKC
jgi:hypothetical protein